MATVQDQQEGIISEEVVPAPREDVLAEPDAADKALANSDVLIRQASRARLVRRVALGCAVLAYFVGLYVAYGVLPSLKQSAYALVALVAAWVTDFDRFLDPDRPGPLQNRSINYLSARYSPSSTNLFSWIYLIWSLASCYADVRHHLANPLDRLSADQRYQIQAQQDRQEQQALQELDKEHPISTP